MTSHPWIERDETVVHVVDAPGADQRIGRREAIPRWGNTSRLVLGGITLCGPIVASLLAVASLSCGSEVPPELLGATFGFFVTHCLITLFYIAFAGQNPRLRSPVRWFLALVFAGPVAIPVYWLIHVWNAPRISGRDVDLLMDGPGVRPGVVRLAYAH